MWCVKLDKFMCFICKCVDVVEISKPKLHVKKYPDRVSVVCLFDVNNITVSQHKPTFSVTWIRIRNGVSTVIKFKFLSDTRDQVVLGKDVLTGDSVACEIMPVHQKQSKSSELLFLGIQVMETNIVLQENGQPETLTFVSTVPLTCETEKCKLDMVLTVKYPKGNTLSNVLLSRCLLDFRPNDRCQGIGCITQQVKVAMTPNLYTLNVKDIHISGYLYVDEQVMWNQDTVQAKIKVIDLPSASCYMTAGVFILSFQNNMSKLSRRGTYILLKSRNNEFEIQIRVTSCPDENLLCVCGAAIYYKETRLIIDRCRSTNKEGDIFIQYRPAMRANMKIFEGRHGKLIYIVLDNKAQVRIDLRHQSMTLTVQSSGYFTDRMDGLCGQIGNNTWYHSNNVQTSQPLVDWRLLPGLSLFENYELLLMTLTPQMPECDCSLSSYETSCPKSSAAKPQFLFHLKETTFYWINKTQGTNQIPDYMFEGDFDDEEIETKQPVKDGQLANDSCKNMFMTSGIAKTCLNKIRIDIDTVMNICVALATSYQNSTWMPEVLRLLENLCETQLNKRSNSTDLGELADVNIEDISQAILCPEGCYGNGICIENGCFCYQGFSGIECLTKTEVTTTTSSTTMPTTSSTTTSTTTSTTLAPTTTTTVTTTTTAPPTVTMTTTPSTTTSTTTTEMTTTTEVPVSMVTCDTRSSHCSTVHVDLLRSGEFVTKCNVTLMQFTQYGWEPVGVVYTTLLRYVDSTTVECMLPIVTRSDDFVNVYRVQIPKGDDMVLSTQIVAVLDSLCQMCDIYGGCTLRTGTCFIDRRCYRDKDTSPRNNCLQCLASNSKNTWSSRTDNFPPTVDRNQSTISVINGDTVKTTITARDPENMDIYYGSNDEGAMVSTSGEFTWNVQLSEPTKRDGRYNFVINVTDSCGASSTFVLTVLVKQCTCQNGGLCENQVVTNNRTDYNCSCSSSFTGKLCETKVNGCHSDPCFPGVHCTETSESYTCGSCLDGYQGDGVNCKKTCASQPCFPGVMCKDLSSPYQGFVCGACPKYYYGNGEKCYRNDEKACERTMCSDLVSCEESLDYPGYHCGDCPHGYIGNGTLCQAFCFPPCKDGKICTQPGVCGCRHGYQGPGCSQAICSIQCQNEGFCYQPDKCFCPPGYTGQYCETELCPLGCANGGSCLGKNLCACLSGYRGHRCEIESCSITCLNGGTCVGFNRCRCTEQFKGIFCEQAVCEPDCINGGVCVRPGVCYCPMGYHGRQCENAFCYPSCENGGYCVAGNQCQCRPGFAGLQCQLKYCLKNMCQNGGRCVGPGACVCRAGWEGKYCRRPTCHLGCQNGGYCYLPNRCRCPPEYWGPFCQFPSCYPPCGYGSLCTSTNYCTCRKYYTGKYCRRRKR
ncbi:von Willebrand factor D and EGF domain-containing protein-like [Mytilus galloprovincialis]|uniref:von Willebrand factor D and EGF domain-containing protein-like n=1 Tax=Mytilus galloprovincialis TaxID=29158 RepID=UPI003F7B39F5